MDVFTEFSELAALLGEPARILMLWHLLGGEIRPAGELAFLANVSPQSASTHLSKLVSAEMLRVTKQGRNRFYSIARPEVAGAIESMSALLPSAGRGLNSPKSAIVSEDFRAARSCYDHLAGKIAIQLAEALQTQNIIAAENKEFIVTTRGADWFKEFGIDVDELKNQRRIFAKRCLDWSERKHHIAGALGAALLQQFFERKWLARCSSNMRSLRLTLDGRSKFYLLLDGKL